MKSIFGWSDLTIIVAIFIIITEGSLIWFIIACHCDSGHQSCLKTGGIEGPGLKTGGFVNPVLKTCGAVVLNFNRRCSIDPSISEYLPLSESVLVSISYSCTL